ncbi:MAG: hypothetical protein L6R42_003284 [Xanthoria sp. 1 TBL-2021]|nr:MAG: hypothetical protein L6R42_003284 [Xanthoria sp. 1 TBL-2021]
MAEPAGLAATADSLLETSTKVAESLTNFDSKHDDHRRLELQAVKLRISLSLGKVKAWQENWFGHAANPGISPVTLWGSQASVIIKCLIEDIVQTSKLIERQLSDVEVKRENQPRSRWKQAIESIRNKQRSANIQKLYDHGKNLSDLIDELWIFADTAFDSRHGLLATEMKPAGTDQLLKSALHSRAGSLELFRLLCSEQKEDCNLEMDLYGYGRSPCYRLVTEPSPQEIRRMKVESLLDQDIPATTAPVDFDGNGVEFFKPSSDSQLRKVPQQGSASPSYLRISGRREVHPLKSSPRSFGEIINITKSTDRFPMEILSRKARITLAFKLTESTLYLLGTPWLSSLNSTNLRRLDSTRGGHPTFMLRTPTSDLKDLLSDDPTALNETAQLFRLGILLIEIALGMEVDLEKRDEAVMPDHNVRTRERLRRLPQVEKAMGLQYCKATAFCLQFSEGKFPGPEKYQGKVYGAWERYLAEMLKDYHAQVFLRMQELQNVSKSSDTDLEQTYVKPKRIPD